MNKGAATGGPPSGRRRIRAAQYLRMSTDRQTYSIENQRDAIEVYADLMGYDIVATYEDAGRSGLNIERRPGLRRLLEDVENGQADFETVVVYDVSRWGRFQNIDESASYEYRCQMAGVRIEYCAEQFANDGSVGSDVLKAIKRSMAAELSRMLSQKTFIGQTRAVKMGFRGGGYAGYGLRRLLVDAAGKPKAVLKRNEWKALASDRVILVPGPEAEIATVRWIFKQFVKGRLEVQIARDLNERGIVTDLDRLWTTASVRSILTNEKYIGNNVWNRTSERLHTRRVKNPPSAWIRADNVSVPLISQKLFERARAVAKTRATRISNVQLLADLSKLLNERGSLSGSIINATPGLSTKSMYIHRFGTLQAAYDLVGYEASANYRYFNVITQLHRRRLEIIQDLVAAIGHAGGVADYDSNAKLMRVNEEFTIAMWIARCRPSPYGYSHWPFRKRRLLGGDVSVLIRVLPDNATVRDYFIAPAWEAEQAPPMLSPNNGVRLDAFLFPSLAPLVELAKRAPIGRAA
ncbi:MAG: recombinase family protein [Mesorhizobium sp.]|uniref:recombinase family protein n=1 Tax=Mesorhizobium sp. TaxID=1871066 RepID=UPI000FE9CA7C|nr:recombinase family protein [Mesorhizobium sp.]RWD29151.1 MAG: recombinase family protein [Mesorhizobium sp.]TJW68553.1 MAG: recombinase family protein [Mesorhizobium sp.]